MIERSDDLQRDLDGIGLSDQETSRRMGTGGFIGFLIRSALTLLVAILLFRIPWGIALWQAFERSMPFEQRSRRPDAAPPQAASGPRSVEVSAGIRRRVAGLHEM